MPRRFGIEIEHRNSMSHTGLAIELQNGGVVVDESATGRYSSRGYNGWQVKHDGSIRATMSHPYQVELVSPPLPFNESGRESVKRAIAIIKETGKVNRSCGFHVHVEASDLNPRNSPACNISLIRGKKF